MSLVRSTVAGRHCATSALLAGVLAIVVACGGSSDDPQPPAPAGSAGSQPPSDLGLANSGCTLHYVANNDAPRTGADPLLPSQWHLANDGRVTGTAGEDLRALAAWPTTRGEGVRVAVVDNAIEVTHDDLAPNVVAGASYDYRLASRGSSYPMPCTSNDSHGTAVAGLASARDDDAVGGSGVAPRSALVGYNALTTGTTADLVDALNRALSISMEIEPAHHQMDVALAVVALATHASFVQPTAECERHKVSRPAVSDLLFIEPTTTGVVSSESVSICL